MQRFCPVDIQLTCGTHMSMRHRILRMPSCPFLEAQITKEPYFLIPITQILIVDLIFLSIVLTIIVDIAKNC
jgi:hypothetical protein